VQLIAEALSNKEIAARLGIEVATVKNHVHNILEKLDVNRRFDAVARLRVVESADEMPTPLELARARSRTRPTAG
jgi:two-component system, NarL family, nitrate/nitrite response regulator NarL